MIPKMAEVDQDVDGLSEVLCGLDGKATVIERECGPLLRGVR